MFWTAPFTLPFENKRESGGYPRRCGGGTECACGIGQGAGIGTGRVSTRLEGLEAAREAWARKGYGG